MKAILKLLFILLLSFLSLTCNSFLNTNISFSSADLHGMIYDYDNQACNNVLIKVDNKLGPLSDINGRFIITNLSRGKHKLQFSKEGYETTEVLIDFQSRIQILYVKIFSFQQLLNCVEEALKNNKIEKAEEFISRASKIKKDDSLLLYLQTIVFLKQNKLNDAIAFLKAILSQDKINPYIYLTLADIYEYNLKDYENALYYLKKYFYFENKDEIIDRINNLELLINKNNNK